MTKNIIAAGTFTLVSGRGKLFNVVINTTAASAITIYDNTAASGKTIATIAASAPVGSNFAYNCEFDTGLTIVTAGASNITVTYA